MEQVNKIDRNETFVAPIIVPGIFDKLHYFEGNGKYTDQFFMKNRNVCWNC